MTYDPNQPQWHAPPAPPSSRQPWWKARWVPIIQYDSKMNEVVRWRFFNAIPIRWEMGEFDSMGNAAQCEILELAVESIKKGK